MTYNRGNLPRTVKDPLPPPAQDIWVEAFNSAYQRLKAPGEQRDSMSRDEAARRAAWSAVRDEYERGPDGKWRPKL